MQEVSAKFLMLEEAKSAELQAVFQLITETEAQGVPKFAPGTTRQLARDITCRNYAPLIHELCHLIVVAEACGPGPNRYEDLFWGTGPARPKNFADFIRRATQERPGGRENGLSLSDKGVAIRYADGLFHLNFSRMPLLSAMMEFLLTALEYEIVDTVLERMLEDGRTMVTISDAAKELSRLMYGYLGDHLPSAQNQRKFRQLVDFMASRLGETFDSMDVDDAAILEFWTEEEAGNDSDGLDFRTFRSVFWAFVRFIQSIEQARSKLGLGAPIPIGGDREAGEIDPAALVEAFEAVHEESDPMRSLDGPPLDQVKFMTKREMKNAELLSSCGRTALQIPVSVMRAEVFGDAQSRISQALRVNTAERELSSLFRNSAGEDYDARRDRYESLSDQLEKTLLASLFVLIRNRCPEAISLIVQLRPDLDLSELAEHFSSIGETDDNVVSMYGDSVSDRFMDLLKDTETSGPELAGLMAESRAAYRRMSRAGFTDRGKEDEDRSEVFGAGVGILLALKDTLDKFIRRLGTLSPEQGNWSEQYRQDRRVFAEQFEKMYGDRR
jgi:hypothetical protein